MEQANIDGFYKLCGVGEFWIGVSPNLDLMKAKHYRLWV